MNTWDVYDRIIYILGSFLAISNQTMSVWISMPANATGPLDPNISLTSEGIRLVEIIGGEAIDFSIMLFQALETLF